jgi:hypothetical protein
MKLSEILRAGKQRIETNGWCQGDELAIRGKEPGPCCAATAPPFWINLNDVMNALDVLKRTIGLDDSTQLANWNDAPGRTVEEVLAAYDKAIAAAEAQEQANV